jgi:hypothetical protein
MNYKEIVKKICVALNIEVKLEQMKLNDGVTVIEADSFEANNEIFVVTEDDQRIPLPPSQEGQPYILENGMLLIVTQEGVIAEIKEQEAPEQVEEEELEKPQAPTETIEKAQVKKTVESMVKETFFSEYEALKSENEALKTQLAQMEEPKAIVHNPEPTEKVKVEAPKSTRDLVMKFINQ